MEFGLGEESSENDRQFVSNSNGVRILLHSYAMIDRFD